MALSQDTVIELGLFLGCIVLLVVMLKLLIDLARKQMIPRPVFVKPDRFRNYEEEQNWSWDFVFVFQVRNVNWHGNAFCQAHTLRKVIEKLKTGKLETFIFKSQKYDKIFVKIRATSTRLKDHADKINYNLKLDELEVKKRMIAGMPDDNGGWKWWPRADGWEYPLTSGKKHNTAITDEKKQSPYLYFEVRAPPSSPSGRSSSSRGYVAVVGDGGGGGGPARWPFVVALLSRLRPRRGPAPRVRNE